MFSPLHILFLVCIIPAAAIAAGLLHRHLPRGAAEGRGLADPAVRVFFLTGLALAASEIFKQGYFYFLVNGRRFDWWIFPFQLCSMAMYLCLLMPLANASLRRVFASFLATFSLVGALAALAYPEDMLRPSIAMTLHGFIWHSVLLFLGFFGMRYPGALSPRRFGQAVLLFLLMAAAATGINVYGWHHPHVEGSYPDMFYITPFVRTTQPVFRDIAKAAGIPAANIIYLCSVIAAAALVRYAAVRILSARRAEG